MELCLRLVFILFVQGGCQAQAECPVPEGAGMLLKLAISCSINKYWIRISLWLWLSVHIYSEPAGEASEGFEAGGVCCRHGQCHQQVWLELFSLMQWSVAMVNVTDRFDLNLSSTHVLSLYFCHRLTYSWLEAYIIQLSGSRGWRLWTGSSRSWRSTTSLSLKR